MTARRHSLLLSVATFSLALVIAVPASAQSTGPDGRWQAWLGCWTPSNTLIRAIGKSASPVVCVIPTTSPSAVEVVTVTGGKIVDRSRVDTDGQPHALAKEGCTGWQSAKWSPTATRVYLKSEFNCSGAPSTQLSAIYAMAGSGEWIDVQGMRVNKKSGVHAVRYREATDAGELPAEITQKLQQRSLARRAALLAVTEQPSIQDVEEASRELDPSVVATWLIEADKLAVERPAQLNAKDLVQLADNGVPGSVIDVMLGLSYPDELAVNPMNYGVTQQNSDSINAQNGSGLGGSSMNGFDRFGDPLQAYGPALMYGCSPYLNGPYDAAWNLYASQYGCGGYNAYSGGLGFDYGYGGYGGYPGYGGYYGGYYGGGPVVVPVGPGTGTASPHGRMVNGRGYTQGNDGSATPRSNSSQPSGSGAGSGGYSPPPSYSPPPPPPQRTAEPKKP